MLRDGLPAWHSDHPIMHLEPICESSLPKTELKSRKYHKCTKPNTKLHISDGVFACTAVVVEMPQCMPHHTYYCRSTMLQMSVPVK